MTTLYVAYFSRGNPEVTNTEAGLHPAALCGERIITLASARTGLLQKLASCMCGPNNLPLYCSHAIFDTSKDPAVPLHHITSK